MYNLSVEIDFHTQDKDGCGIYPHEIPKGSKNPILREMRKSCGRLVVATFADDGEASIEFHIPGCPQVWIDRDQLLDALVQLKVVKSFK